MRRPLPVVTYINIFRTLNAQLIPRSFFHCQLLWYNKKIVYYIFGLSRNYFKSLNLEGKYMHMYSGYDKRGTTFAVYVVTQTRPVANGMWKWPKII